MRKCIKKKLKMSIFNLEMLATISFKLFSFYFIDFLSLYTILHDYPGPLFSRSTYTNHLYPKGKLNLK